MRPDRVFHTGKAIPADKIDHFSIAFYKFTTATPARVSTGTHQRCLFEDVHRGNICKSTKGHGTTFTVLAACWCRALRHGGDHAEELGTDPSVRSHSSIIRRPRNL